MKAFATVLFLAGALVGAEAHATCTHPTPPQKIPDGATSSKQEMIEGMKAVRTFDQAIKAYTDCLRLEHDAAVKGIDPKADPKQIKAQKAELDNVWVKKNDAAVDEDNSVATRFNEQVKIYKQKAAGKS